MIKISIVSILISSSLFAKNSEYYYLNNKECQIAIPVEFYIPDNFSKHQINFLYKTKTMMVSTGNKNKYLSWIKNDTKANNDILIKDSNISCLSYQKYKIKITQDIFEYKHIISGKDFLLMGNDINQSDIDYMIQHCIKTYKK